MWCRSRRFDCILLIFFRRWGRMIMRDLIKYDALLWLIVIQKLWLVHFDPCCSLSDLLPRRSAVARLSCCCVFWSWASTLLEFLFHYPYWCCHSLLAETTSYLISCFHLFITLIRSHLTKQIAYRLYNSNLTDNNATFYQQVGGARYLMFCITFSAITTETGDPIAIPCNLFVVYTVVLKTNWR